MRARRVDRAWLKVSEQCGLGEWIHWFRVGRGPIRVKKVCGFENIRIRVHVT